MPTSEFFPKITKTYISGSIRPDISSFELAIAYLVLLKKTQLVIYPNVKETIFSTCLSNNEIWMPKWLLTPMQLVASFSHVKLHSGAATQSKLSLTLTGAQFEFLHIMAV